jgi:hypothetical protein
VLAERGAVKPQVGVELQADGLGSAVKNVVANRLAEAVERTAQAGAGFPPIALGPQQGRQRVATVQLATHRQVHQQRQRFAQVQLERPTIALQARLAENEQLEGCHRGSSRCQGIIPEIRG